MFSARCKTFWRAQRVLGVTQLLSELVMALSSQLMVRGTIQRLKWVLECVFNQINQPKNWQKNRPFEPVQNATTSVNTSCLQHTFSPVSTAGLCRTVSQAKSEFLAPALTQLKQSKNHPDTTLVSSLISGFSLFHLDKWQGIDILMVSESVFIGSVKVRSLSPTSF